MKEKQNEHLRLLYDAITDFLALSYHYRLQDEEWNGLPSDQFKPLQTRIGEGFEVIGEYCRQYGYRVRASAETMEHHIKYGPREGILSKRFPKSLLYQLGKAYRHSPELRHRTSQLMQPLSHRAMDGMEVVSIVLPKLLQHIGRASYPVRIMEVLSPIAFVPIRSFSGVTAALDSGELTNLESHPFLKKEILAQHSYGNILGCPAFKEPSTACKHHLTSTGVIPEQARGNYARKLIPELVDAMRIELPQWLEQAENPQISEEEQLFIQHGWEKVQY